MLLSNLLNWLTDTSNVKTPSGDKKRGGKLLYRFFRRLFPRSTFSSDSVQTLGVTGDEVVSFQQLLNRRGRRYDVRVELTGIYDEQTRSAVRLYQQRAFNIQHSDGFVGPQTAKRLNIRLIER